MLAKIQPFPRPPAKQQDDAVALDFAEIGTLTGLTPTEYSRTGSLGPAVPDELLLGTLRDGRLRVWSPITVKFTTEDEHVIAEAVEFNEFGFGKNISEALRDLQRTIVELYLTLEEEQDRLGSDLQSVWTKLQHKIRRR